MSGLQGEFGLGTGVQTNVHVWHIEAFNDGTGPYGIKGGIKSLGHFLGGRHEGSVLVLSKVVHIGSLTFRDYDELSRHRGEPVSNDKRLFVFINEVRGNLPFQNFGEN